MIAVNTQTIIFLQAILMGAVFGAVYDLFRIFRIAVPLPAGVIVAEDVIYFAFCGFMSFFLAMTVNFGQVRFFILLGELLGFLLYYLTLGVLVMKCAQQIIAFIRWIFQVLWKLILRPVVRLLMWIGKKVAKIFGKLGKNAKKLCKRTENTCKLGVYYCIIILKIGELYPQKRERFFGEKNKPGLCQGEAVHGKTKENFKEQVAEDSGLSFCGVYCVFHCCAAVGNSRSENNAGGSAAAVSTANRRKQRGRAVVGNEC